MKLENQVVSLELAKKMKSLGFEQESTWYWCQDQIDGWERPFLLQGHGMHKEYYSAYTVAELGEMLPDWFYSEKNQGSWLGLHAISPCKLYKADTEANVRTKILIHLKENNLI